MGRFIWAKWVTVVARDRNIIVHGLVTAQMQPGQVVQEWHVSNPPPLKRPPCWTIYMGEDAGRNFPISLSAVETVCANIEKVAQATLSFNVRHGFLQHTVPELEVQADWPKPLEGSP